MEKRAYNRIPVSIKIRYLEWRIGFFKNQYTGTIKNITEKGMFISTNYDVPLDSIIEVCIPVKKKIFGISIKKKIFCITANLISIVWGGELSKDSNVGIGIKLSNPPKEYLEFVGSLKSESL
jgi:hypothetical protein